MERPSALPPYSRVMEVSACVKLWNSRDSLSGAMPTPQIINPSGTRSSVARLGSAGCDAALKAPLVLSPDAGRPASATRQVRTWRPPDRPAFLPWHTVRLEVQHSCRFKTPVKLFVPALRERLVGLPSLLLRHLSQALLHPIKTKLLQQASDLRQVVLQCCARQRVLQLPEAGNGGELVTGQ